MKITNNGSFYLKKSTVDFVGLAHNRHVDFDVKSTKKTTSFPLSMLETHQYAWLEKSKQQGSKSFLLIQFEKLREWYVLEFDLLDSYWREWKQGGKASIPIQDFRLYAIPVKEGGKTGLDFLEFVRKEDTNVGRTKKRGA